MVLVLSSGVLVEWAGDGLGGDHDGARHHRLVCCVEVGREEPVRPRLDPDRLAEPGDDGGGDRGALEGRTQLQAAGGRNTAIVRTFDTTVTGGELRLDFTGITGKAIVSNLSVTAR